jgi:hypothetical protein
MKNENEIKRAFAMEVIEKFNHSDQVYYNTFDIVKTVQSLIPKEEEVDRKYVEDYNWIIGRRYKWNGQERDMTTGNDFLLVDFNLDQEYITILDDYSQEHQMLFSEWHLFEIVEPETNTESNYEKTLKRQLAQEFKEATQEMQEQFVKANPEMKFSDIKDLDPEIQKAFNEFSKLTRRKEPKRKRFESDEVKAGDEVKWCQNFGEDFCKDGSIFTGGRSFGSGKYILERRDGSFFIATHIQKITPEPILEQKARKKAIEMWNDWNKDPLNSMDRYLYEALLIDPKTL